MSSFETELDRSINVLYNHMITKIDRVDNPDIQNINYVVVNDRVFKGMCFRYSYYNNSFFLECVIDNMYVEGHMKIFELKYEKVDKDDPDSLKNQFKVMCKDMFKLCKVEFYDKVSNKIFLSKEDMDKFINENIFRAESIIGGRVDECCVCMELCGTQLDCCNGWICYKCYNKTHKPDTDCDCGGCRCKNFTCPLCRTKQEF